MPARVTFSRSTAVFNFADRLFDDILAGTFARNLDSFRGADFSAFEDLGSNPHMAVQLVVKGSEFDSFLEWRQRLEQVPALREQFDDRKRRHDGQSMADYGAAKSKFLDTHLVV